MRDISLLEMLQNGVHFGHQKSRRHPKMMPFIYTDRNGISIVDLEKTKEALGRAAAFVTSLVAKGGNIIFVGTKRQARTIVQDAAQQAGMPYITNRWIGGLLTNFSHVRELIVSMARLKEDRAAGGWAKYTKKEQLDLQNELERLDMLVGGVAGMEKLPDAMFVVDIKTERTAVQEATTVGLPIVALCDTNVNPVHIAYPIPANDDATKSIRLLCSVIVEAVQAGRTQHEQHLVETAQAAQAAAEVAAATAAASEPTAT